MKMLAHGLAACALLAMMAAGFAGCSAIERRALPLASLAHAAPPGLADVRAWGDTDVDTLTRWAQELSVDEKRILADAGVEFVPPASYVALSGGGEDGAFGAGLLCGWTVAGTRPTFKLVTGVSAGALTAPFVFAGPEHDHVLHDVFRDLSMEQVATSRNIFSGLINDSFFVTKPLRKLLEQHVTDEFLAQVAGEHRKGRGLWIATTNLDAQRPVIWSMGRIAASGHPKARDLFIDVMLASASIPGVFPPVMIDVEADGVRYDEMHVDGGTTTQVFLYPATFSVRDFSAANAMKRERHIYVIRNARIDPAYRPVRRRTAAIAQRAVSSLIASQGVGDLYRIYLECLRDDVDFNLASIPESVRADHDAMFDQEYMRRLFDTAFELAKDGYEWEKVPPGFENSFMTVPGQTPADPSPTR
jgi:predicted acylesterase/phospholipase RssA